MSYDLLGRIQLELEKLNARTQQLQQEKAEAIRVILTEEQAQSAAADKENQSIIKAK